jgi:hypothetical protein
MSIQRAAPHATHAEVLRLSLAGIGAQFFRLTRIVGTLLYAIWWWLVVGMGVVIGWTLVMILPRLDWRWNVTRWISRFALTAVGATPKVAGVNHILPRQCRPRFQPLQLRGFACTRGRSAGPTCFRCQA